MVTVLRFCFAFVTPTMFLPTGEISQFPYLDEKSQSKTLTKAFLQTKVN